MSQLTICQSRPRGSAWHDQTTTDVAWRTSFAPTQNAAAVTGIRNAGYTDRGLIRLPGWLA